MRFQNTPGHFSSPFKFLHWTTACLVMAQFVLMWRRAALPDGAPEKLQYILWHKSIGITLLCCIILLGIFRSIGARPPALHSMPRWEKIAATLSHAILYFLVLFMPIVGYLMSTFNGYDVRWFGYLLPKVVGVNKAYAGLCYDLHIYSAYALGAVIGVHILASIKHHCFDKDRILQRMLPERRERP